MLVVDYDDWFLGFVAGFENYVGNLFVANTSLCKLSENLISVYLLTVVALIITYTLMNVHARTQEVSNRYPCTRAVGLSVH